MRMEVTELRSRPIAIVSGNGDVTIDWDEVDNVVASPIKHDLTTLTCAKIMIAVRDQEREKCAKTIERSAGPKTKSFALHVAAAIRKTK